MDISLKNLKVMISAGGSGIGKAILEGFHSQGAKIATCDINSDLIKILKDEYPDIYTEVLDVSDEHEVQSHCRLVRMSKCMFNEPIFFHQKLRPKTSAQRERINNKPILCCR
jgi:short-subunit dehydrogenase involved in D-alanine esterification of teichoic acids